MLLRLLGVYLPYFVIEFSRRFLEPDNEMVDIPCLTAGFLWRLRYGYCLIRRQEWVIKTVDKKNHSYQGRSMNGQYIAGKRLTCCTAQKG